MGPVDYIGREIKVGDEVVYGTLLNRSAAISRGEIIEIIPAEPDYRGNPTFKFKIQRKHGDGSLIFKQKYVYGDGLGSGHYVDTHPSTAVINFQKRMVVISN